MAARTAVLGAALALAACGGADGDPDRRIEGGGTIAAGWSARLDEADADLGQVRFVATADGFEASNGPNVVFWRPEPRATGSFELGCEVVHLDSHAHPHGAGLLFGGQGLDGGEPRYSYFLVAEDGRYLVKRRDGAETVTLAPWTVHDAVRRRDGATPARNELRVVADGGGEVAFLVNGAEVFRAPARSLHVDGAFGFRMVHNLDLRFRGPTLQPRPAGGPR